MGENSTASQRDERIDRPIFVVGPHRSGTTLLYRILSKHPDLGYISLASRRFPGHPFIAHLLTRLWIADKPVEAQRVWDYHWSGPDDVMTAAHATPEVTRWYRDLIASVLRLRGASRFVAKYPRLTMRVEWLDALFPDALYVHIVRDWRAVMSSTLNRRRKRESKSDRWYGMRIPGWQEMRDLPPYDAAALQYRLATTHIEERAAGLGPRYLRITYNQLCDAPVETIREVARHCGLAFDERFAATVPTELRSANYKWRETLDAASLDRIRAEHPEFFSQHEEA